jgi:hypothetical protein
MWNRSKLFSTHEFIAVKDITGEDKAEVIRCCHYPYSRKEYDPVEGDAGNELDID